MGTVFCKNSFIGELFWPFRIYGYDFQKIFRIYGYTFEKFLRIYEYAFEKSPNSCAVLLRFEWHNPVSLKLKLMGHKRQTNRIHGPLEVNINGGPINWVKKVKYLVVTVDENGMSNIRASKIKSKMPFRSCGLRKLKNTLPQSKLDQVYKVLLQSHLRYSDDL